ncbi:MAG: hypothetical protein ACTS27_10210, partial [Phycisphaerales bacterium]
MAATFVLSQFASASWPAHDADQNGVIGFYDLSAAVQSSNFPAIAAVLSEWGSLVAPEHLGDPNGPGATAQAIARWNAVPGQFVSGLFRVGVVAHHMDGIAEVRFFRNGSPIGTATTRSVNPDTGNKEYWITINTDALAEGEYTLSAIVLPNEGRPRILTGECTAATAGKGEHGLDIVVRRRSPAQVFVGYGGSDANPGTRNAPFLTIGHAIRVVPDGGEVVLLNAGGYEMPQNGYGHLRRDNEHWITIRPDDGLPHELVGITGETRTILRANLRRVRFKDLMIDFAKVSQIYNTGEQMAWLDHCIMTDSQGWTVENRPVSVRNPWFVTDSLAVNKLYAYSGATLARNSTARQISGDVFQNTGMVVGCDVENVDGTVLAHHTDLIQIFGARDNLIVAELNATGLRQVQSFFLEPTFEGTPDISERMLTNSAYVDIHIDIEPVFQWNANEGAMVNWGGAPWSQMLTRFDHVVFDNVQLANQRFMIRTEVTGLQAFHANNVVFRNFGLHPLSYETYLGVGGSGVPDGVTFENCYP